MALTKKQASEIKDQLLQNIEHFPENQRDLIKQKVLSLSPKELEKFLKENKLVQPQGQCIFCSIIKNEIPSYKIDENSENIAILELNPLSKGHSLILPKTHADKLSDSSETLANKVIETIKQKLKPKEIKLQPTNIMGHALIEIIPVYDDNPQEKKKASDKELQELQKTLAQPKEKPKPEQIKIEKPKQKKIPKLSPRIP